VNFFADESVERSIVERLRQDGHDVLYGAEFSPGAVDETVLQEANIRVAVLITADKDFGEIVFRLRSIHAGVVLLRLAGLTEATKADIVARVCRERGDQFPGAFSVVSPGQVRVRHG
jgi:predicted nuclease of predicted toxin-antitoxin system